MRWTCIALGAAFALAGCGAANDPTSVGATADSGTFPNLDAASFHASAVSTDENGRHTQIEQYRSGARSRLEFTSDQGRTIMLYDLRTHAAHMVMPAERLAMRIAPDQGLGSPEQIWTADQAAGAVVTAGAPCTAAGEIGREWSAVKGAEPAAAVCVTADGVILQMSQGERVTWQIAAIQRGPQNPQLFVVPAGYNLQDMSALQEVPEPEGKQKTDD